MAPSRAPPRALPASLSLISLLCRRSSSVPGSSRPVPVHRRWLRMCMARTESTGVTIGFHGPDFMLPGPCSSSAPHRWTPWCRELAGHPCRSSLTTPVVLPARVRLQFLAMESALASVFHSVAPRLAAPSLVPSSLGVSSMVLLRSPWPPSELTQVG
ncbi:uncharacterized protein [Zea mays]|jgi:hypothetical protein|uniref:Secreted protein n=1 Tax=Zea mays TaxID=4577 RepID=A0A804MK98_MAIZE|nr:uncharacterized protein LOC109944561 [Zea mays]|eukprot:XP_020404923.1 uncharacterized protein LOC109944561 [Zea mays]